MLLPSEGLELEVVPRITDQELRTSIRYWEGAVEVRGTSRGEPVEGDGYVELTGYGE
jgi:predicted secreted hydrolase